MTRSGFRIAALVLFGALFATNLYRAATQSIVHDEALTWQLYLSGPASMIFQYYDPNHHFLATILFRISTTLFGQSELAMRLPTVLAGAWFFWTVFRLCLLVFGEGWLFLLGCATLALNPILLDFLVAARGYGLALAGLFWALYQMLAWFDNQAHGVAERELHKRLWKAALGCSIAVATNLTLLIPAFILALGFCVLILRAGGKPASVQASVSPPASKPRKKSKKLKSEAAPQATSSYARLIHFVIPVGILAVVFLLAAPIDLARSEDFYVGTPTALKSLRNLMDVSFAYGDGSGAMHQIEQIWSSIALIFFPAIAMAALIVALLKFAAITNKQPSMAELVALLASLTVVGSAILLVAAHLVAGIPYPTDRTGIYFVPLTSLASLGLVRILADRPGIPRWAGFATAMVFALFALEFAAQWNVSSFLVWRFDADTKRVFEALEAASKPAGPIRLGVSWVFEPALNYYREVRKASWLTPVKRDGFEGDRQFYVVSTDDQSRAPWPHVKQIYKGPLTGTVLTIPQSAQ